jgi:hypothetical protein
MSALSPALAAALERWRSRLLDLSRDNPLLHLPGGRQGVLAFSRPGPAAIYDQLRVGANFSFLTPFCQENSDGGLQVESDLEQDELLRTLARLQRRSASARFDRGLQLLYVGFGFLAWRDDEGDIYRSPLLLLPVEFLKSLPVAPFQLGPVGDPGVNPALEARLLQDFDFRLPGFVPAEKSLPDYLAEVQSTVSGLPGWKVENAAVLGAFPFAGTEAYRDLLENRERIAGHPIVQVLIGAVGSEVLARANATAGKDRDSEQPPDEVLTVLDADADQQRCLEAAARGESFVIQGPPGTGTTQTIANLVAGCLAGGKTVLVVSPKMAALENIAACLEQVGLRDFCLELYGEKVAVRPVLTELRRCLELSHKAPTPENQAGDEEQLRQCRERLEGYAEELHRAREPFQQSVWWALGELARCHDLPALALRLSDGTEMSPAWLEDCRQALGRAGQLGDVRQDPAFPWRGFKLERYHKQLRDEVLGLVEKTRTRLERLNVLARDYGKQVEAEGPVGWLLHLADLLESSTRPPAQWLTSENLQELAQDLERASGAFREKGQSREPLTARYGQGVWHLPEGTAGQLTATWQQVQPLLAGGDEKGATFLKYQQHLRGWAADTQRRIPGWLTEARVLEKWLGLSLPAGTAARPGAEKLDPSVAGLRRLLRLANLCQTDAPPERSWVVDAAALAKAKTLIEQSRPAFAEFRQGKTALLGSYTEDFFELDMERLGAGYAGLYRSWLRVFSPQFRRDRRAIRRRTVARVVPPTVADDVLAARDLQRIRRRLEEEGAQRQPFLGRYEKGIDTDLEAAERGTRVAAEAAELARHLGCAAVPGRLADALSAQLPAPEKARTAARRLHDSLAAWLQHTHELETVLPVTQFPDAGGPLEEVALSALQHFAHQLQGPLNHFAALVDPVLGKAATPAPDVATLLADLHEAGRLHATEATEATESARWSKQLGPNFQGTATDWVGMRRSLAWTQRLKALFADRPASEGGPAALSEKVMRIVTGQAPTPSSREMRAAREQLEQALHGLEIRFEAPGPVWSGKTPRELSPEHLQRWLQTLRNRVEDLASWAEWRTLQRRFEHLGLAAFWEELQNVQIPAGRLQDLFLKAVLASWIDKVFKEEPALGNFRRTEHEQIIEAFCRLDQAAIHRAAARATALAQRSEGTFADQKEALLSPEQQGWGSAALRRFFAVIPDLLLRLKPCLLLNSLAVGSLLPADKMGFDVVVFDEASQLTTAEAISAICRGRRVVVCGDDQQLPPLAITSGDEPEAIPASEGLLGSCLAVELPVYTLSCHYRSKHEGLFAFANRHFYDGRLVTFPAADGVTGVHFHHLSGGRYSRGVNELEAQAVADLVCAHVRAHGSNQSLGVAAFSPGQAMAIADEIERHLVQEPDLRSLYRPDRSESFFVQSVEAAQGQVRDVIFLSVGFGADRQSQPVLDFGTLTEEGGEKRLNIATTRAREKLVVVSSLRATDVPVDATQLPGVKLLRAFLDYAERGAEVLREGTGGGEALPSLPADVLAEVGHLGYKAVPAVGAGDFHLDLGVLADDESGRFLLGICCDGPGYQETATARDRDRLRPRELKRRGWRLHRIWAPAWVFHRQEEVDRLRQALADASS